MPTPTAAKGTACLQGPKLLSLPGPHHSSLHPQEQMTQADLFIGTCVPKGLKEKLSLEKPGQRPLKDRKQKQKNKERSVALVKNSVGEIRPWKNQLTPSNSGSTGFRYGEHGPRLGGLELRGGDPVLDWQSGDREERWWWLMARTWIQAPWQH